MSNAKRLFTKTPVPKKSARSLITGEVIHRRTHKIKRSNSTLFKKIVVGAPLTGLPAIKVIRSGYLVDVLKSASNFFDVPDVRIQNIAHVPATTASRLEQKKAKIDSAATERIFRMGVVTRMAIDIFENQDAAIFWMKQPNRVFDNVAPLDLMDTEPGAAAVKQVLNAIATGGVV